MGYHHRSDNWKSTLNNFKLRLKKWVSLPDSKTLLHLILGIGIQKMSRVLDEPVIKISTKQ